MSRRARLIAVLVAGFAAAALPASASALEFQVTSTADSGDAIPGNGVCRTLITQVCTLRAALQEANASFGADTVVLPAGTYNAATPLTSSNDVTVTGAGARTTIVDGPAGDTVFASTGGNSTLRGLTITGGRQGIVSTNTDLELDQVAVRGNTFNSAGSAQGGGISVSGGHVLLRRSAVTDNHLVSTGGTDTTGAGIVAWNGNVTLIASTVAANTGSGANTAFAGGVFVGGTGAILTLRHATIASNTISAISGGQNGGGVLLGMGATGSTTDSVLTGNIANAGTQNCGSLKPVSAGGNLESGTSCGFGPTGSSVDLQLGALGDHGGPTDTAVPALGSPARDAATACPEGGSDQRSAPAPTGAACDSGAVELAADVAVTAEASRPDAPAGADVTYLVRVTNNGPDDASAATLDATVAGASAILVASPSAGTCTTAIHCNLGTIARGATVTVTIVVRAGPGGLTLTARGGTTWPDASAANDAATIATAAPATGAAGGLDRTAPALGRLKLSGKARRRHTASLTATLSEDATVTLQIDRLVAGRRAAKRCVAAGRRGPRCTVARRVGAVRLTAKAGSPVLRLPATFSKRSLAPGRHRITATAVDAAGNRSAAQTLVIVVRP